MSYTYAERKKAGVKAAAPEKSARTEALSRGAAKPTAAEMGHRVDLPDAMRMRMESSFGADLSGVKLYESQAVGYAGAEAVTQGSSIAFAPGKLDFTSSGGQALLGHELSHVVSQQRGEVTGGGFLNDQSLEARADREGAMAARGESVYGGATAPLSTASAAPAAGPMQAKRNKTRDYKEDSKSLIRLSMKQQAGEKLSRKDQKFLSANTGKWDPKMMDALLAERDQSAKYLANSETPDEDEANWMNTANSLFEGMHDAGSEDEQYQFANDINARPEYLINNNIFDKARNKHKKK